MKVGDLVRCDGIERDEISIGLVLKVERPFSASLSDYVRLTALWDDGEIQYVTAEDCEVISESR